jgi:hypothetical protein
VVFADTTQLNGEGSNSFSASTTYYYYALSTTLTPSSMLSYTTFTAPDIDLDGEYKWRRQLFLLIHNFNCNQYFIGILFD